MTIKEFNNLKNNRTIIINMPSDSGQYPGWHTNMNVFDKQINNKKDFSQCGSNRTDSILIALTRTSWVFNCEWLSVINETVDDFNLKCLNNI